MPRHIIARYHRKSMGNRPLWVRYYANLQNAMKRAQELIYQDGQVGDVIEFYLVVNQMHVGWMRMPANGKVLSSWNMKRGVDTKMEGTSLLRSTMDELVHTAKRIGVTQDELIDRLRKSIELEQTS